MDWCDDWDTFSIASDMTERANMELMFDDFDIDIEVLDSLEVFEIASASASKTSASASKTSASASKAPLNKTPTKGVSKSNNANSIKKLASAVKNSKVGQDNAATVKPSTGSVGYKFKKPADLGVMPMPTPKNVQNVNNGRTVEDNVQKIQVGQQRGRGRGSYKCTVPRLVNTKTNTTIQSNRNGTTRPSNGNSSNYTGNSSNYTANNPNYSGNDSNGNSSNYTANNQNYSGNNSNGINSSYPGNNSNNTGNNQNYSGNNSNGVNSSYPGNNSNYSANYGASVSGTSVYQNKTIQSSVSGSSGYQNKTIQSPITSYLEQTFSTDVSMEELNPADIVLPGPVTFTRDTAAATATGTALAGFRISRR